MTKLLKYSRTYHCLLFLCLSLPFFYTGCAHKTEATVESTKVDSVNIVVDTSAQVDKYSQTDTNLDSVKSISRDQEINQNEEKLLSQKISIWSPFFKPILIPQTDTFTGLAMLIDSVANIQYFSFFLFWFLLCLSLLIKFIERNAFKVILLLDTLSLIFLLLAKPVAFEFHRLYGVWVTIGFLLILIIIDSFILKNEIKRSKSSNLKVF
ncbi:MAG: hypothetical protein U0V72_09405 [Cytophagales bacterium]